MTDEDLARIWSRTWIKVHGIGSTFKFKLIGFSEAGFRVQAKGSYRSTGYSPSAEIFAESLTPPPNGKLWWRFIQGDDPNRESFYDELMTKAVEEIRALAERELLRKSVIATEEKRKRAKRAERYAWLRKWLKRPSPAAEEAVGYLFVYALVLFQIAAAAMAVLVGTKELWK